VTAVIESERLCKRYASARGIDDLSLTVQQGDIFGFLGPNGAGKTTTIRTLLDLLHPTSGSARVLGLDSRRDSLAIRARLGNLPGEFAYDERVTGRELLEFFAVVAEHRDRGATIFLSSHDLEEVERICNRVAIIREGRLIAVEDVQEMRGRAYRDVRCASATPSRRPSSPASRAWRRSPPTARRCASACSAISIPSSRRSQPTRCSTLRSRDRRSRSSS